MKEFNNLARNPNRASPAPPVCTATCPVAGCGRRIEDADGVCYPHWRRLTYAERADYKRVKHARLAGEASAQDMQAALAAAVAAIELALACDAEGGVA